MLSNDCQNFNTLQCNCATEFVYAQGQMDQFVSLQLHVCRLHTEKALVQSLYVTEQYLVLYQAEPSS